MDSQFRFLLYRAADESVSVNAIIKDETIWLSQKSMAELFGCSTDNISLHLKNIYASEELSEEATSEIFSVVQTEGSRKIRRSVTFLLNSEPDKQAESVISIIHPFIVNTSLYRDILLRISSKLCRNMPKRNV